MIFGLSTRKLKIMRKSKRNHRCCLKQSHAIRVVRSLRSYRGDPLREAASVCRHKAAAAKTV